MSRILKKAFLLFNLMGLIWLATFYWQQRDASTWPTARARILSTQTVVLNGKFGALQCLQLTVQHQVAGVSHLSLQTVQCHRSHARMLIARKAYPLGWTIAIFYNPRSPEIAWLHRPDLHHLRTIMSLFLLVDVFLLIFLYVVFFQAKKPAVRL